MGRYPAATVPPPGRTGRLGQPLSDPRPAVRGRHPRRAGRPARRRLHLPAAQAHSLVHDRSYRAGRGGARISRRDDAQHLRQLSHGHARARCVDTGGRVKRSRLARHDLDDDSLDLAGERGHRRPSRPDLCRHLLPRPVLRADRSHDPGGGPGGQGDGHGEDHRLHRGGPLPRQGTRARRVPPSVHRSGLADRAGRICERRGRNRPRPYRAGPRSRGLPDRADLSALRAQPGRSVRTVHRPRRPIGWPASKFSPPIPGSSST